MLKTWKKINYVSHTIEHVMKKVVKFLKGTNFYGFSNAQETRTVLQFALRSVRFLLS